MALFSDTNPRNEDSSNTSLKKINQILQTNSGGGGGGGDATAENQTLQLNEAKETNEKAFGKNGGILIDDTLPLEDTVYAFTVLNDCTITSITSDLVGSDKLIGTTLPAGVTIFGETTYLAISSGLVIGYF